MTGFISVRGARTHNLKNIDVCIPRNSLTVITGVSGSGKSTFAFDLLYSEGQRRFLESLSTYARQFLEKAPKPLADSITGIQPAVAVRRSSTVSSARETVGTATEIYDLFTILFAHSAELACPQCNAPVKDWTPDTIIADLFQRFGNGSDVVAGVRIQLPEDLELTSMLPVIRSRGFTRFYVPGKGVVNTPEDPGKGGCVFPALTKTTLGRPAAHNRLARNLEQALQAGPAAVFREGDAEPVMYSHRQTCPECRTEYPRRPPSFFSFKNPEGACPECSGFGRVIVFNEDLIVPDKTLSLVQGAISPWNKRAYRRFMKRLIASAQSHGIPLDIPYGNLSIEHRTLILDGGRGFVGVRPFFKRLEKKIYKLHIRVFLSRYRDYDPCPLCGGSRIKREGLAYRIKDQTIYDICCHEIHAVRDFMSSAVFDAQRYPAHVIADIRKRLEVMTDLGLGYLTLARQCRTLSAGELQRVHLASSITSSMVDTMYVIDEPTVGLHPQDTSLLIKTIEKLHGAHENTVIIVEHDRDIIEKAEYVLDLGLYGGYKGGDVVYFGPAQKLRSCTKSITAKYLTHRQADAKYRNANCGDTWLTIEGCIHNNLHNIDVSLPLNRLVCVTGPSGAGKTTLTRDIIFNHLSEYLNGRPPVRPYCKSIKGYEEIESVELVEQGGLPKSSRSNAATYMGFYSAVREILARQPAARLSGITPGMFSFNIEGGRCPDCKGAGFITTDMQFLSDIVLECENCGGRRFRQRVLDVLYKGKNIDDILNTTVSEAVDIFADSARIRTQLEILISVGLDYITLGQPCSTLSSGEMQRLKLASYINLKTKNTLFIFDEPTVGLHFYDVDKLVDCLHKLLENNNSIIVVEHNMDMINYAHYIVDLGPGGGNAGGRVTAYGTPRDVSRTSTATGKALKKYFSQ